MSNWTDFRDEIVASLQVETVTEDMKTAFVKWLLETALPIAQESADNFISQIKAQALSETGWCKMRDLVILPTVITGGLWLVEQALKKADI